MSESNGVTSADAANTTAPPLISAMPKIGGGLPAHGSLVRIRPLQVTELPAHPDLASLQSSATPPDLHSFVKQVLGEASTFMTAYVPMHFGVKSESKASPPSAAGVQLLSHEIAATQLPEEARRAGAGSEAWFARTSIHRNEKSKGTADWGEFEGGILDNHSQHEMEYTPDVFDAHQVLSWDRELGEVDGWKKVGMSIYEMAHHIPPPLNNRVFPVLVVTALYTATSPSFIVVQIPVDIAKVPHALYSNGRHKKNGDTDKKKKDVTLGAYVSIERVELLADGPEIRWQMATASDAKGNVPMWAQKMGVPGAIVKDVGLFMDWTMQKRQVKAAGIV